MEITLEQVREAIRGGWHVRVVINGGELEIDTASFLNDSRTATAPEKCTK